MNDTTPALRLESVRKVYPTGDEEVVALDHATLTVGHDEIVALVGPSGSGKTTLCSIAGGILPATDGTVCAAGEDITGFTPAQLTDFRREHVGFVFQTVNLVPFLTAARTCSSSTRSAGGPARPHAAGPTSCSRSSASPPGGTTCPASSRADSVSGSRSAAP